LLCCTALLLRCVALLLRCVALLLRCVALPQGRPARLEVQLVARQLLLREDQQGEQVLEPTVVIANRS
jgi:hypothetical protein